MRKNNCMMMYSEIHYSHTSNKPTYSVLLHLVDPAHGKVAALRAPDGHMIGLYEPSI